jgi:hypothetical protein
MDELIGRMAERIQKDANAAFVDDTQEQAMKALHADSQELARFSPKQIAAVQSSLNAMEKGKPEFAFVDVEATGNINTTKECYGNTIYATPDHETTLEPSDNDHNCPEK